MANMIKIQTIYGKVLTLKIKEQTEEYVSGYDKFGVFCKVPFENIKSCDSMGWQDE